MSGYAAGTAVPVERSKAEIERLLARYGCSSFGTGWSNEGSDHFAHITFKHGDTAIMCGITMPRPEEFRFTPSGRRRHGGSPAIREAYEAEKRRRWRALLLIIKAKLEAVSIGITTLEREFLADIVLPDGRTLGSWAMPVLNAITTGRLALPAHAAEDR